MALDPSISLQTQPVQIQNPLTQYANVAAIQNAQQQNALTGLAIQKAQRDQSQADVLNSAFKAPGAVNADGSLNSNGILTNVANAGAGSAIPALSKQLTEATTAQLAQQKARIEGATTQLNAVGQVLNGVHDQASWDAARVWAHTNLGASSLDNAPAEYNPGLVEQAKNQALTAQQALDQHNKQLDYELQTRNADETQRHNLATEQTGAGQLAVARDNAATNRGTLAVAQQNANRQQQTATQANQQQQAVLQGGLATYDQALHTLDGLEKSPGLSKAVGFASSFPTLGGTDAANFEAQLDTFRAQNFLPMVANLKGMGALSDAEGKKLTDAVGALSTKQSEPAFRASLAGIKDTLMQARARLAGQLGTVAPGVSTAPANPVGSAVTAGTVKQAGGKSYRFDGHGWTEVQ
ncbi:hypothetical protein [Paraburkholderia lycopersici]|uniref:Uncharacterized protein n=1 Tax=Paraburkholderia lycopersici TaxID=416944 RepID=A0A1G6K398_9BURK|nr:hypothetical protein [Paraburkholderia lycopersici]SDC25417.1 hypothetical protein SAMN05421548_10583 [Paraburkholderia lycopersici]